MVCNVQGGIGTVVLNRPKALNALNLEMIREIRPMLADWEKRDDVHAVLMLGAGEKAFCAGGDVRGTPRWTLLTP